jgi:hypothetical protein
VVLSSAKEGVTAVGSCHIIEDYNKILAISCKFLEDADSFEFLARQ